jgi:glycosyltransferase involved in cell wall biosynthesis
MRVLQVVTTVDGANWAVDQVTELVKYGLEMHVVLPRLDGIFMDDWRRSGAQLHQLVIDLPLRTPWRFSKMTKSIRDLVSTISPDIIHSHFFSSTLALRYALGRNHAIPRLFQVPGPFHMEHGLFRKWELSSAGRNDSWIASSRYTRELYLSSGIRKDRLYLSYYGNKHPPLPDAGAGLRTQYGIGKDQFVVGNVNYMYSPRLYFGHIKGIKRHEDVIDALAQVIEHTDTVYGLIIGGQWGGGTQYEQKLKARAARVGRDHIIMTGRLPAAQAKSAWVDFDVAVHVPVSENCGGVIEPLMAGVPVIAAHTGGLPEVILDGITGKLVQPGNPTALAEAISEVLGELPKYKSMAQQGRRLVRHMFDVRRTAAEISTIYKYTLEPSLPRPEMFDSRQYMLT